MRASERNRGRAVTTSRRDRFRFPCGHIEGEAGVSRRLRARERAVWVRCAQCNVVAFAVEASRGRTSRRRPSPRA
jgi:hypothetical protein